MTALLRRLQEPFLFFVFAFPPFFIDEMSRIRFMPCHVYIITLTPL